MRVLLVTPEYPPHTAGGILRYYRVLAPALARQGCEVTVLVCAPSSPDFADYDEAGVRVICVRRADAEARADELAQFSAAPEFRRWLGGALVAGEMARALGKWDVIEAVDFGLTFVPFMHDDFGAPVVVQMHGSLAQIADHEPVRPDHLLDDALARLAEVTLLPGAAELQTCATGNAREWEQRIGRAIRVMAPPMEPVPAGSSSSAGDMLVVGRVQAWKGPGLLCAALRELPTSFPVVRWVGRDTQTAPDGGSLSAHLEEEYPGVWGSRVLPMGQRSFEEVRTLMAAARAVIVPSNWDVFNLTAAEAMSAGRVVVCSSGAGASDLITHGLNGFVFGAGDATSLAAALREIEGLSQADAEQIGRAARATIVTRLDPDAVAAERVKRYQALITTGARSRLTPPEWVREVFSGGGAFRVGPAFLDQMDVKELSKYLGKRLKGKLIEQLGHGADQ